MRSIVARTLIIFILLFVAVTPFVDAISIDLYADSAPNVYGSPDWTPWWTATKADVAAGTFTNLRTGTYPGTDMISPYDEIVYSTMDLGKRLHWIYWLPGQTTTGLDGLFQVKWVIDWDGDAWSYNWTTYSWIEDAPDAGWVQPGSWEDYSGGVIGSFGFAWWAGDNEAPPYDTGGSPWDETDQADINALALEVSQYQTYARGMTRYRNSTSDSWQMGPEIQLRVQPVPEPSTILFFGLGIFGIGAAVWRRRKGYQS